MNAEIGVDPVLEQIQRAGAQRVVASAGLDIVVVLETGIRDGVTLDHLIGGAPGGPLFFDVDGGGAGKLQPRFADATAVADRLARLGDKIQVEGSRHDQQLPRLELFLDAHELRRGVVGGRLLLGQRRAGYKAACGGGCQECAACEHVGSLQNIK